jgi:hypothetical protein
MHLHASRDGCRAPVGVESSTAPNAHSLTHPTWVWVGADAASDRLAGHAAYSILSACHVFTGKKVLFGMAGGHLWGAENATAPDAHQPPTPSPHSCMHAHLITPSSWGVFQHTWTQSTALYAPHGAWCVQDTPTAPDVAPPLDLVKKQCWKRLWGLICCPHMLSVSKIRMRTAGLHTRLGAPASCRSLNPFQVRMM